MSRYARQPAYLKLDLLMLDSKYATVVSTCMMLWCTRRTPGGHLTEKTHGLLYSLGLSITRGGMFLSSKNGTLSSSRSNSDPLAAAVLKSAFSHVYMYEDPCLKVLLGGTNHDVCTLGLYIGKYLWGTRVPRCRVSSRPSFGPMSDALHLACSGVFALPPGCWHVEKDIKLVLIDEVIANDILCGMGIEVLGPT